jgi:hypothetical protein
MVIDPTRVPPPLDAKSEAEEYGPMSVEQRAFLLVAACRAAATILESRADAKVALDFVDPLPESTLRALARLRAQYRSRATRASTEAT